MNAHRDRAGSAWGSVVAGVALIGAVLLLVTPAVAGVKGSVGPDYSTNASVVDIGDTRAITFSLQNTSDGTQSADSMAVSQIRFTPSCASSSNIPCLAADADPNVFQIDTPTTTPPGTITGAAGTACAGRTFTLGAADPVTGETELIPDTPFQLGPSNGSGGPAICVIDLTITVLKFPTKDASVSPGLQTDGLGRATYTDAGPNSPGLVAAASGSDETTVTGPDVTISKQATLSPISAGGQAQYTIVVQNQGDGDALNVTLTDTVPGGVAAPGWTVGGPDAGACSPNPVGGGSLLTCNFGTVSAGQSKTITITATATSDNCPVINNSATVTASNEPAGAQGNNSAGPVPIAVNCPDVTVTKAAAQASINAGDQASYTITVTNTGQGDATDVTLTDTVPAGVAAPGWTVGGPDGGACAPNPVGGGGLLTCNFGTVPAGGAKTITITATTTPDNCPVINNSATVTASNEPASAQGNNSAGPIPINVICPDVTVLKSTSTPTVNAGGSASYSITVTNNGPGTATNVTLTDTVPGSVAAPGWTVAGPDAGACSPNPVAGGSQLTCNFGTVAFPGSRTITLTATTTVANCPAIANTATVSATDDTNPGNNTSGPVTINVTCPNLQISTTPNPSSGKLGTVLNDTATLTGGINPQGNITFTLFAPDDQTCAGSGVFTQVVPASGNGTFSTTGNFAANASGTWHWTAVFNGTDAGQEVTVSSVCAEPVIITGEVIPTLSEWGMLLMVTTLVATSFVMLRRRRRGMA